jgi:hypothetical protein
LCQQQLLGVFERRISGLKRDAITGDWRNCITCTLRQVYIIRIKSRRIRWAWACNTSAKRRLHIGFRWECQKEDLAVAVYVILRLILKPDMMGEDWSGSGQGLVAGSCEWQILE